MSKKFRAALGALLIGTLAATAASAGERKGATDVQTAPREKTARVKVVRAKAQPVQGEEDFRSAMGYHAVVMEHCKAINKLARGTGGFNTALAREHATEIERNLGSASKHYASYLAELSPGLKAQAQAKGGDAMSVDVDRLAGNLKSSLAAGSPDRKEVIAAVIDLYTAVRGQVTAQKEVGKALGIRPATAPHRSTPRAPKKKKEASTETAMGTVK